MGCAHSVCALCSRGGGVPPVVLCTGGGGGTGASGGVRSHQPGVSYGVRRGSRQDERQRAARVARPAECVGQLGLFSA